MTNEEFKRISKMSFCEFMCLPLDKIFEVREEMEKEKPGYTGGYARHAIKSPTV